MSRRERANRQRNHALENTFALGTEGGDARAVLGLVRALAADALLACAKSFIRGAGSFSSARNARATRADEKYATIRAPGPRSDVKSSCCFCDPHGVRKHVDTRINRHSPRRARREARSRRAIRRAREKKADNLRPGAPTPDADANVRLVPDILRSSARRSPSANTTRRLKFGGTSSVDRASALIPRVVAAPPASPLADARSGASSSSSPYLARLYRSPSAKPFSSRTVGSEPGAGSLMRYLMDRGRKSQRRRESNRERARERIESRTNARTNRGDATRGDVAARRGASRAHDNLRWSK